MANHKSAEKRSRQNVKRRARNRQVTSSMRTAIKKVREAIEKKSLANIDDLLREAQSVIAKTRKAGVIHKNNMARRIGRLTMAVKKAKNPTATSAQQ